MTITISETKQDLGRDAAAKGATLLRSTLKEKGHARIILATGASQFEMLKELTAQADIDWSAVEMFHLDEYVGISADHPASFRRYLQERFIDVVHPGKVWLIEGDAGDLDAEIRRLSDAVRAEPVDVAFVGIGENGHLAFNDPPADFETQEPYLVMQLDEACRRQQVGEGWFDTVEDVPGKAVSMSVRQIMASRTIIASVPDSRKAVAVRDCLAEGAVVSPDHPASILKEHPEAFVFLDRSSASLL